MPLSKLRRGGLPAALALLALATGSAVGDEALVEVNNIVLRADGGFQPQSLPRHRYVPIEFEGHVDISAKRGGKPPALRQALIDFDRDGRLNVAGLPSCAPEAIAGTGAAEARRICRGAIVGTGRIEATVSLVVGTVRATSALTVFNGPRLNGNPTAILHARTAVPASRTYVIVVPIEPLSGRFRYRARVDLPPLADGLGALTHIEVEIGRRYRAGGTSRSYVSARCGDGIMRTHGRFEFDDGTVISGQVEKYCRSR
jgi:hypothetical protein